MGLSSGRLRHRVAIERFVETISPSGERSKTWQPVATVWGEVAPISGKDLIAAQQANSEIRTRITIRARTDIDATMRAVWRNTIYTIAAVLADKDSGIEYQTLHCRSGVIKS